MDEVLAARTRKKPLVLLLDEAHTLDAEVGYALLNASQKIGRDLPFLLVLAGTPGLPSHLNTMNASFWNRAERRPIGRLDSEATAAAIREPLEGEHITIDQDALEHVVRASHGYPYFVQVWGQALWRQVAGTAAPKAGRRLTRAETEAARTDFERERNNYSLDRYEELENLRLLPVARAVADAFGAQPLLEDAEIEAAVLTGFRTSGGTDGMTEARDAIRDLGYVWRPKATPAWGARHPEPGGLRAYTPTAPLSVAAGELAAWISAIREDCLNGNPASRTQHLLRARPKRRLRRNFNLRAQGQTPVAVRRAGALHPGAVRLQLPRDLDTAAVAVVALDVEAPVVTELFVEPRHQILDRGRASA